MIMETMRKDIGEMKLMDFISWVSKHKGLSTTPTEVVVPKLKPFYLTPNRVNDVSTVKTLTQRFGLDQDGVKTFNTGRISMGVNTTPYNRCGFYLLLINDVVYLRDILGQVGSTEVSWNIETLVSRMKERNPRKEISKVMIEKLILTGRLVVKFNVSKIKDHGTLWTVIS